MMFRWIVLTAVTGLGALPLSTLPAAAQASEVQQAAIAAAIEAAGCRVTAENNAGILAEAGLAEADAATVVQALLDAGDAVIEGGELVLKSEACP
jgi:hypothetical protein